MCPHILACPFSLFPSSHPFSQSSSDSVALIENFSSVLQSTAFSVWAFLHFFSSGNSHPLFLHIFPLLHFNFSLFLGLLVFRDWHVYFLSLYLLAFCIIIIIFFISVCSVFLWQSYPILLLTDHLSAVSILL